MSCSHSAFVLCLRGTALPFKRSVLPSCSSAWLITLFAALKMVAVAGLQQRESAAYLVTSLDAPVRMQRLPAVLEHMARQSPAKSSCRYARPTRPH